MVKELIPVNMDDVALIALLKEKKSEAIELIYIKYWNKLVQYAYNFLKDWDTSEEMVQRLFVNIYVKNISLNNGVQLGGYLHRSVKNEVSNHQRKQSVYQRHVSQSSLDLKVSKDHVQNIMESFDVKLNIHKAVDAIPEKIRVVYILNREQQLTIKEISKKLKRPEDTIDKQLRRAVYFLRTRLNAFMI
jgi:RNA polymerase sigma-70 factor (ECF subfamily)